jgi:hypothetical protein
MFPGPESRARMRDILSRSHPNKVKSAPGDNFWAAGKKYAPKFWSEVHNSFDQKALEAARRWDAGSARDFWTWLALGDAAGYWTASQICAAAPYLAKLGPESWLGAVLDVAGLGKGRLTVKAVQGLARGIKGINVLRRIQGTASTIEEFAPLLSTPFGRLTRQLIGKGRRALGQDWKRSTDNLREYNTTQHTQAELKFPPDIVKHSRSFNRNNNTIPPKSLQSTFRPDRPGQPGWGMEIKRSRPFNWNNNTIPPKSLQSTFRPDRPGQPGWGMEIKRSRPFNWNNNTIPPKSLQNTFRPDRPGQPGWGMEINRSRPIGQPGSLSWMAKGLR